MNFTRIIIWQNQSVLTTRNISVQSQARTRIFVTSTGDIYMSAGYNQVQILRTNNSTSVMTFIPENATCWSLFVDLDDSLYCSMKEHHRVIRKFGNSHENDSTMVAGNGSRGSTANLLNEPHGIFVNAKFELYVADSKNGRIQRFSPNNSTGTTVAGEGVPGCVSLWYPVEIMLDADNNLYIAELSLHRIVRAGPDGCRCLVGCWGVNGSEMHHLNWPRTLSFDRSGNIYVADTRNQRIQNFSLANNACGMYRESSPRRQLITKE